MKKTNQLLTFSVLTVLMLLLAVFTYPSKSVVHVHEDSGKAFFPELKAKLNDVQKFTLRDSNTTYTFFKGENAWILKEKADFPVKIEPIRQLLIGLAKLEKHSPKTALEEHYEVLNLNDLSEADSKVKEVTLYDPQGNILADLFVGKKGPTLIKGEKEDNSVESYYVRQKSEAQSWLAKGSVEVTFSLDSWLETKLLNIGKEQVTSISISYTPPIEVYQDETGIFKLRNMKAYDQSSVNELANLFSFFYFDDVKTAVDFDSDTIEAEYALSDSAMIHLQYQKSENGDWVKLTLNSDTNASTMYAGLSQMLENRMFKVSPYKVNILNKPLQGYEVQAGTEND